VEESGAVATDDYAERVARLQQFPANRAEVASRLIGELAAIKGPGTRLGTKDELRAQCHVSVGTFNEALKISQNRGVVALRPGPGGGIFAAAQSPLVRLGNLFLALDDSETTVLEAVRMRNALDPLLIEDALVAASPADITAMRVQLDVMEAAVGNSDATAFTLANWHLHAYIARISPNSILRGVYLGLLEVIEAHTLSVEPPRVQPVAEYIEYRQNLHVRIVDSIESGDRDLALRLIDEHNTERNGEHPGTVS
jgi:DNA-binding FadR family transcriptional regulator